MRALQMRDGDGDGGGGGGGAGGGGGGGDDRRPHPGTYPPDQRNTSFSSHVIIIWGGGSDSTIIGSLPCWISSTPFLSIFLTRWWGDEMGVEVENERGTARAATPLDLAPAALRVPAQHGRSRT